MGESLFSIWTEAFWDWYSRVGCQTEFLDCNGSRNAQMIPMYWYSVCALE